MHASVRHHTEHYHIIYCHCPDTAPTACAHRARGHSYPHRGPISETAELLALEPGLDTGYVTQVCGPAWALVPWSALVLYLSIDQVDSNARVQCMRLRNVAR